MNMKKTIYLILVICNVQSIQAQFRSYSNEFLNIGVSARSFAMGNASVANTDDVYGTYWNPAALAQVQEDWQASIMHAAYFEGIANYDYAAVAIPLENRNTVGISFYRFGVDDILNTTQLIDDQGNIDYDNISTFSSADYALMFSYGGSFFNVENMYFGVNAKLIYRNIGSFANAFGTGFDAGVQYINRDFKAGLMVRDLTTSFNVWSVNEEELNQITVDGVTLNEPPEETIEFTLPKIQLGVSQKMYFGDKFTALGELDLIFNFRENYSLVSTEQLSMSPAAGIEIGYDDMVFIRGGVNNFQRVDNFDGDQKIQFQPNVGVGFRYKGITVDYAFTDIGDNSVALYSNIFSVKLDMGRFY